MNQTKIKICGLCCPADIDYVNAALPDYGGFVFYEKSHRNVTPRQVEILREKLMPGIVPVGVFVDAKPRRIKELYDGGVIDIVQLHGEEDDRYIENLRNLLPGVGIWKAFRVRTVSALAAAKSSNADMVLLDNGCGTGQCFDWSLAADFRRPLILAGGLTPENLSEAIRRFRPFAVDISSGVETEKRKDRVKILAAVEKVRRQ